MTENIRIGIVSGKKLTDALLCHAIIQKFPNTRIIKYRMPVYMWFSWIIKRIHKLGIIILIGHILLSIYLKFQRKIEFLFQKSLWLKYIKVSPSWNAIPNKKLCLSEKKLIKEMKKVNFVIFTDQFRFSPNFFKQIKVPIFELIWGDAPNYMGDSSGFWEFAINNKNQVGITIIKRFKQYDKVKIIQKETVALDNLEDIRTIKIKQAIKMAEIIPETIQRFLNNKKNISTFKEKTICRLFQAPTLFTYLSFLKFGKINNLPKYSYKKTNCTLIHLK